MEKNLGILNFKGENNGRRTRPDTGFTGKSRCGQRFFQNKYIYKKIASFINPVDNVDAISSFCYPQSCHHQKMTVGDEKKARKQDFVVMSFFYPRF